MRNVVIQRESRPGRIGIRAAAGRTAAAHAFRRAWLDTHAPRGAQRADALTTGTPGRLSAGPAILEDGSGGVRRGFETGFSPSRLPHRAAWIRVQAAAVARRQATGAATGRAGRNAGRMV